MSLSPLALLQQYWGHTDFRPKQEAIIDSVLSGTDVLALMPTGGGKSICYQLPAVLKPGIAIVISPLLSLMRDQVLQLGHRGIKAMYIPGGTSYRELDTLLDNCIYGNYKLLYLSPERLQQELVLERIKQMNVSLLAIDEAHCISQWGHDFRPAYRAIFAFRESVPGVTCLALTATATEKVAADIIDQLQLTGAKIYKSSFERKNLAYMVLPEEDKYYRLERLVTQAPGSAIIYVRSRKTAQKYSAYLNSKNIGAHFYHGGLGNEERGLRFAQWMNNEVQVMVATNAFGMGIDKPDVQTVVHVELPESLEAYFQEAGRAGRDGGTAKSIILYSPSDIARVKDQFINVLPDVEAVRHIYKKLNSYFRVPYGEGDQEVFRFNFMDFCRTYDLNTLIAYNTLQILDRNSILMLAQEFFRKASLQISVSPVTLTYHLIKNPGMDLVVKTILRTYGGIFDQMMAIDHAAIAKKSGKSVAEVHRALLTLAKDNLAQYDHKSFDTAITFLVRREDDLVINSIAKEIKLQNARKIGQIDAILTYVNNNKICRSRQLLAYFGEAKTEDCGLCDVCLRSRRKDGKPIKEIAPNIFTIVSASPKTSREICEALHAYSETEILKTLKALLEQGRLSLNANNTYTLST